MTDHEDGVGTPVTDLPQLLATLEPVVRKGEFVYTTLAGSATTLAPEALVREDEGTTVVLPRDVADSAGLPYDFVACWITLSAHSSLNAVGLTAAFSTALASAGISCNVLAGYHHDHLLVPVEYTDAALRLLRGVSEQVAPVTRQQTTSS